MGRRRKKRYSKRSSERSGDGQDGDGYGFVETLVQNGNFKMEAYYAAQGIHDAYWNAEGELVRCKDDAEKEAERRRWRKRIATILPASFRIGKDVNPDLRDRMEAELEELLKTCQTEGDEQIIKKIGFNSHAYQLGLDRTAIRKKEELAELHQWLKRRTEAGFITRQETVSMIPPVALAPNPSDSIFDMCAAPGK